MVRRYELSDEQWDVLAPLLPNRRMGRPRVDDRRVLNGMVWKIRSGAPWRDVPARYGPWQSVYTRFRRWAIAGVFGEMLAVLQAHADDRDEIDWLVSIDSTMVRAHHHAAGASKKGTQNRTNRTITPWDDPEVD